MTESLIYRDVSGSIVTSETDGNKTLEFSFASETPHRRFDWETWEIVEEILDCKETAIRGSRLQDGLIQFLWNHNPDEVRGVIKSITWGDGKGRATAKMSRTQPALELYQNVIDEIIRGISVGYRVYKYEVISNAVWEGDSWDSKLISPKKVRAIEWEPFEISACSIPADATVGIGRSDRPIPNTLPQLITAIGIDKLKKALNEMTQDKTEARNSSEYQELDQKYRNSQAELNTLKTENEALRGQVLALQAETSNYKKAAEISQKYASLRSTAEGLVRSTKLASHEFEQLFARDADAILAEAEPLAELRAIELVLNMRQQSAPALNTQPSKVPAELPATTVTKAADLEEKSPAILGYENAWK